MTSLWLQPVYPTRQSRRTLPGKPNSQYRPYVKGGEKSEGMSLPRIVSRLARCLSVY